MLGCRGRKRRIELGAIGLAEPEEASSGQGVETGVSLAPVGLAGGGRNSATASPRSVTSTRSPFRTWRRYSLRRFLSSRMPTTRMLPM
jgi:hypothetical protein